MDSVLYIQIQLEKMTTDTLKEPELIKKINPWIILGLLLILYFFIIIKTPNVLTGDELFYYDQAQNIRGGTLSYFDNTQPFGFPLLIAGLGTDNIMLLRLFNAAIFIIGLYFLYKITAHLSNKSAGLLALLIAGLAKFSVQTSTLLLTEPLFVLTTFAATWYFIKTLDDNHTKNYLFLGFWLILAIQTKITNLVLPIAFALYILAYTPKKFTFKFITTLTISLASLIPYLILTQGKFLVEKIALENTEILPDPLFFIVSTIFYFTIPFIILILFTAFFYKLESKERILTTLALTYLVLLFVSKTILFPRHLFPFFLFVLPLISISIIKQKERLRIIGLIIVSLFLIINIVTLPQLPEFDDNNYFFNVPSNCIQLKNFEIQTGENITLPYFAQPTKTLYKYTTTFFSDIPLDVISLNYADDFVAQLTLDRTDYVQGLLSGTSYSSKNFYFNNKVSPGYHTLSISIINSINIGGLGQVLLCEDKTKSLDLN
ncbi:hypothetical protein COV13_00710 [Candidatus Woesearchaeota archaeon CG10_big_fil_rev_8_21_14_0_10_32_9]|nr:MAG: hypothetical protein COV13_00710 [Candidatus Woesearchaeota archaeon CG10_big_fil_rev_8_21_14_0_10_32_9]